MPNAPIEKIRHSLSHLMSMAMQEIYPKVGLGVGPTIENGFYQDYGLSEAITPDILPKLEKRIKELIKENIKFEQRDVDLKEAYDFYKHDPYKTELIDDLKTAGEKKVSFYKSGWFDNLCAGPHVSSTKEINPDAFKLTKIAGAYWRGSEKNAMLTRIYGVAFNTKKELDDYLAREKEAALRDHRVIGKNLGLFVFSDLVGKGLPLFTEKGSITRRIMERFIVDEETKRGYKHVYTPEIAKVDLYKTSGHYPYYKDSMYPVMKIDNEELILRPMTCPHHFELYKSRIRTYKELPLRIAELAKQFRYEKSGELTGLIRLRSFCLSDAHIFCIKEETNEEVNKVLDLIEFVSKSLGLKAGEDYRYRLSLGERGDSKKYYKDDKAWDFAENILRNVLKKRKSNFFEAENEAAFYGPKIDIQIKNFSGKEDTAFTVQYDFVMPKRFNLSYIDKDGQKKEPVVIHRSSIGAIERVMAFILEKHAGALPLWLSPEQIWVIPISSGHGKYAREVFKKLEESGFRAQLKDENETVSKKIREGEIQKIPYLLIIGDKEMKSKSVAVRQHGKGDIGMLKLNKFLEKIKD